MGEQGLLDGVEVFFITDNSTAEAVFYNGNSKNEASSLAQVGDGLQF